jgi:hypothetical protein
MTTQSASGFTSVIMRTSWFLLMLCWMVAKDAEQARIISRPVHEIGEFVSCNADQYVDLIFFNDFNGQIVNDLWMQLALQNGIYVTQKKLSLEAEEEEKDPPATFNIVVISPHQDLEASVERSLELMNNFTVKSFLLYFPSELSPVQWNRMTQVISNVSQNALFYLAELKSDDDGMLTWKQILTIQHQTQVVVNDLKFVGKFRLTNKIKHF